MTSPCDFPSSSKPAFQPSLRLPSLDRCFQTWPVVTVALALNNNDNKNNTTQISLSSRLPEAESLLCSSSSGQRAALPLGSGIWLHLFPSLFPIWGTLSVFCHCTCCPWLPEPKTVFFKNWAWAWEAGWQTERNLFPFAQEKTVLEF